VLAVRRIGFDPIGRDVDLSLKTGEPAQMTD
jgi:hypothetical protein